MDITDMSSIKKNLMKNHEGSSLDHQTKTNALDTSLGIKMLESPVNVLTKHTTADWSYAVYTRANAKTNQPHNY